MLLFHMTCTCIHTNYFCFCISEANEDYYLQRLKTLERGAIHHRVFDTEGDMCIKTHNYKSEAKGDCQMVQGVFANNTDVSKFIVYDITKFPVLVKDACVIITDFIKKPDK